MATCSPWCAREGWCSSGGSRTVDAELDLLHDLLRVAGLN